MPTVHVTADSSGGLVENELIGDNAQPRWTAKRRFPSTRVYVRPEGKFEFESWARGTFDDGEAKWRFLQEIDIGLPGRFQLDLYLREDYSTESTKPCGAPSSKSATALADWGKLWGNPTLYFEYVLLDDRPDKIEGRSCCSVATFRTAGTGARTSSASWNSAANASRNTRSPPRFPTP
ncbi:MAG: hypothetical protein R3F11_19535 [Verrucomicrobiales bacterium]